MQKTTAQCLSDFDSSKATTYFEFSGRAGFFLRRRALWVVATLQVPPAGKQRLLDPIRTPFESFRFQCRSKAPHKEFMEGSKGV
jgi:hypothetical protein